MLDDTVLQKEGYTYFNSFSCLFLLQFTFTAVHRMVFLTWAKNQVKSGKVTYNTLIIGGDKNAVDLYDEIDRFGENCKRLMANLFTEKRDGRKLRMSNIGRDDRYLWNVVNNPDVQEEMTPNTYVKFMYGHLIEEMLLFLTRLSGHEVTDEQKRCEVSGITGSMDCKIDGEVVDIKTASNFSFKKFSEFFDVFCHFDFVSL